MSKHSDDFEKKIARIYTVLDASNSKVTWNDKIPDPDNPAQLRQIDISIVNDLSTTYVECRIHNTRQDVKWIEELQGRKESLGADFIIAVSSSGFTAGAILKAARFGIELRDTIELEDEDLISWGSFTSMSYEYFTYDSFSVNIVMASEEAAHEITPDFTRHMADYPNFIRDLLNGIPITEMRERYLSGGNFSIKRTLKWKKPMYLKAHEVSFIVYEIKNISLVQENITLKRTVTFGDSLTKVAERDISIQTFANNKGNIVRNGSRISLHFVNPGHHIPDNSILCQRKYSLKNIIPIELIYSEEISEEGSEGRFNTIQVEISWGTITY